MSQPDIRTIPLHRSPTTHDSSEDGLACQFVESEPNLRWCQTWGKWLVWDGSVWRQDETVAVFDRIRAFCRKRSKALGLSDTEQRKVCSAATIAAVERLCKSDRKYAAIPDQFDCHDWLLNTPGGIVNLIDGTMTDADPEAYFTKSTAVAPEGDCPRWLEFLNEITNQDGELVGFLQRMVGYFLTGSTREHALFFLYGSGGNGKSVFIDTANGVLNDYSTTSPMATFTESQNDTNTADLADLQGARMVSASETESGKRWAQAKIKQATGGDKIKARFLYKNFFEYKPKFKLVIAGNTKPKLDNVDEAMRRRFHIVPFTQHIPADRRDPDLAEKLRQEFGGILAWAIEGCLQYQAQGLNPPAAVTEATADYLEAQDVFGEWLQSECEFGPDLWEGPKLLFNSWKTYAESNRERVGRPAEFKERVESAGYFQRKDKIRGRFWEGLKCKPIESKW